MSVHLSDSEMVQLVELYKEYDCLWDMKHEYYRDKEVRQTAYKEITKKLNIPNLKVKDIPNKIKNLRSSYYQEIKKIRRSIRLGQSVYTPKVTWFPTVDGFLRPFRHERKLISKRPLKGKDRTNVDKHFHKVNSNKIQKESKQVERTAERIIPPNSTSKGEDEFDSFGKYIAASLRLMPPEYAIIAKTELQKTISDIQLKIVRQKMNAGNNEVRSQSPCDSGKTSSDEENQQSECSSPSPTSDSCISTIKIEYENDDME